LNFTLIAFNDGEVAGIKKSFDGVATNGCCTGAEGCKLTGAVKGI
jgi:hypothetical protein